MIIFLWIFTIAQAIISCLFVASTLDPVNRLVAQIMTYQAGSFQYAILDFYFQSLSYIIVYVGAIAILFQFVIMMIPTSHITNTNESNTLQNNSILSRIFFGFLIIGSLFIALNQSLSETISTSGIVTYFYPSWTTSYLYFTDFYTLGYMLYLVYPLSFILIGQALWITQIGIIPQTNK